MNLDTEPADHSLDFAAAARFPIRVAAHILGAGLVVAVLAALPAALTDLDRHQLPKETVVHLATWLAVVLARPVPPLGLRPAMRWALLFLVFISVVSAIVATNPWIAARATALTITAAAAFVTARHIAALGAGRILIGWCATAALLGAATSLAQAYGFTSVLFATTRAPGGTFGNRNFMAHFSAIALPLVMVSVLTTRRHLVIWCGAVGSAILFGAIVLSRSRAAWIGAAAGTAVLILGILIARRRGPIGVPRGRVRWIAAALLGGAVAALVLPNSLEWRSDSPYADTLADIANQSEGSGRGRIIQYTNTLHLFAKNPALGVGPGNWPIRYADVAPPSDPSWAWNDDIPINPWPSSDWLALLSERGIAALAAVLLLGAAIAWRAFLGLAELGDRAIAAIALAAILAVVALIGLFDAVLLLPAPVLLVAIALGALLQRVDGAPSLEAMTTRTAISGAFALIVILGAITARSALQTGAYVVAGKGRVTSRLVWAARLDPGSYPIRVALAQRISCPAAGRHGRAALLLAPLWPAARSAARRCG